MADPLSFFIIGKERNLYAILKEDFLSIFNATLLYHGKRMITTHFPDCVHFSYKIFKNQRTRKVPGSQLPPGKRQKGSSLIAWSIGLPDRLPDCTSILRIHRATIRPHVKSHLKAKTAQSLLFTTKPCFFHGMPLKNKMANLKNYPENTKFVYYFCKFSIQESLAKVNVRKKDFLQVFLGFLTKNSAKSQK